MGTYSSLLHLGKVGKAIKPATPVFEGTAFEENEGGSDQPESQTSLPISPVAPTPRPATQSNQTEPVGESPRRSVGLSPRRRLARAAFDIYEDQIQSIKRLKNQRQLELDRDVSKSEIVREALELFFKSLT